MGDAPALQGFTPSTASRVSPLFLRGIPFSGGCLPPVEANLDFSKSSFILVVNQKSSMSFVLDRLANLLGVVLADIFADSRYDSYIVVNYVHTSHTPSLSLQLQFRKRRTNNKKRLQALLPADGLPQHSGLQCPGAKGAADPEGRPRGPVLLSSHAGFLRRLRLHGQPGRGCQAGQLFPLE